MHNYVLDSNTILCTNLQTLLNAGKTTLVIQKVMGLLLVVVCGSKYFQKWKSSGLSYRDSLITYLLTNHGMALRSPNKGPEAILCLRLLRRIVSVN